MFTQKVLLVKAHCRNQSCMIDARSCLQAEKAFAVSQRETLEASLQRLDQEAEALRRRLSDSEAQRDHLAEVNQQLSHELEQLHATGAAAPTHTADSPSKAALPADALSGGKATESDERQPIPAAAQAPVEAQAVEKPAQLQSQVAVKAAAHAHLEKEHQQLQQEAAILRSSAAAHGQVQTRIYMCIRQTLMITMSATQQLRKAMCTSGACFAGGSETPVSRRSGCSAAGGAASADGHTRAGQPRCLAAAAGMVHARNQLFEKGWHGRLPCITITKAALCQSRLWLHLWSDGIAVSWHLAATRWGSCPDAGAAGPAAAARGILRIRPSGRQVPLQLLHLGVAVPHSGDAARLCSSVSGLGTSPAAACEWCRGQRDAAAMTIDKLVAANAELSDQLNGQAPANGGQRQRLDSHQTELPGGLQVLLGPCCCRLMGTARPQLSGGLSIWD